MKILIITGKFGMGHFSAAFSLAKRMAAVNPQADIEVKDFFDYAMPACSDQIYKSFGHMVTHWSRAYNAYYNYMNRKGPDIKPVFLSYFMKKWEQLMKEEEPDVVLSTFPLCSQIVSWHKGKTGCAIPLITCITDISSHSEWINEGTDCYLVPDRAVKNSIVGKGVDGQKVYVYGIPVRPEFDGTDINYDKAAADAATQSMSYEGGGPSVKTDMRKHVLIMGGGLGILPDSREFYEELNSSGRMKVTVITGKNREIYDKLYGKYENIEVLGFTDEVYRYMKEADVVISKPGGITLFETIHSGTPLLVFEPFLQQEINNTGFIIKRGIGMVLEKNPRACVREISRIMENDSLLEMMTANVLNLKQEYEHVSIIQVLALLGVSSRGMDSCEGHGLEDDGFDSGQDRNKYEVYA